MKVRFKNPPINELAIGVYFDPPLIPFRSEHIGLLWSRLRNEFPKVEQRDPLSIGVHGHVPPAFGGDGYPYMPRFWFVSDDEVNLVQVQNNAYFLNWRKRENEYPHFHEQLKPSFDRHLAMFKQFLREEIGIPKVGIGLCELTYVDVIESCEYWRGPQDTSKLIPSFKMLECGVKNSVAHDFACMYDWEINSNLHLLTSMRIAEPRDASDSRRLILEFKALGQPIGATTSHLNKWYDEAHDAIVSHFLNLTDKDVQRGYWLLEGSDE
ncbi:MAG: TIGR04255 family protein [Gammaproteobacteria bacterium]|nr:TIGR04255 family protein [Gammaproteobacteria bacterium]